MFIHSHVVPNPYAGVCFCFFLGAQIFMEPFLIKVHSVHNLYLQIVEKNTINKMIWKT